MLYTGKGLILLFGRPRSGTTWIAKIFDSHPDVVYKHEPEATRPLKEVPLWVPENEVEKYAASLRDYSQEVSRMSHHRIVGKLPLLDKSYAHAWQKRIQLLTVAGARLAERLSVNLPVYDPGRAAVAQGAPVVWKSVVGLGRLPALLKALPDAKGVVILRHPCGYVSSQLRGLSGGHFGGVRGSGIVKRLLPPLRKLAEDKYQLTPEEFSQALPEQRLAWRWLLSYDSVLSQVAGLPNCTTVWYDDLCLDPVKGFQELFACTGLSWGAATEAFLDQTTLLKKDSYYSIFKDPSVSALRWRDELSPEVINRILDIACRNPLMASWLERQGGEEK